MKEDKYFEEKISRALEAIKHPENFTDEELRKLLNDTKILFISKYVLGVHVDNQQKNRILRQI